MAGMTDQNDDSTFELNLAPMLDIIVSIVPMLLLSVAFVQVTVIDTPIPQAVEQAIAAAAEKNKDQIQITLRVSKSAGFLFVVMDKGQGKDQTREIPIGLASGEFDLEGLHRETVALKKSYPDVFRLELHPEEAVSLKELVAVMDSIRTIGNGEPKVRFDDVATGRSIETNLLFPDVVFGNVAGG